MFIIIVFNYTNVETAIGDSNPIIAVFVGRVWDYALAASPDISRAG